MGSRIEHELARFSYSSSRSNSCSHFLSRRQPGCPLALQAQLCLSQLRRPQAERRLQRWQQRQQQRKLPPDNMIPREGQRDRVWLQSGNNKIPFSKRLRHCKLWTKNASAAGTRPGSSGSGARARVSLSLQPGNRHRRAGWQAHLTNKSAEQPVG